MNINVGQHKETDYTGFELDTFYCMCRLIDWFWCSYLTWSSSVGPRWTGNTGTGTGTLSVWRRTAGAPGRWVVKGWGIYCGFPERTKCQQYREKLHHKKAKQRFRIYMYVLRHHFMNISVDVAYIRILGYDANHRKNDFFMSFFQDRQLQYGVVNRQADKWSKPTLNKDIN